MTNGRTEVFKAYEVECPECHEFIVLRPRHDTWPVRTLYSCPRCKCRLPRHFLTARRLTRKAVECFSFDCDSCGQETVSYVPPTRCRECGAGLDTTSDAASSRG